MKAREYFQGIFAEGVQGPPTALPFNASRHLAASFPDRAEGSSFADLEELFLSSLMARVAAPGPVGMDAHPARTG